jgi:toxin-antitoxin system PIN domain toxin
VSATVDANVLIYASNADDELHQRARELVVRLAGGPELLYVFWPTIMRFLRIATHPAIFRRPASPKQAIAAMTALLERPTVRTEAEDGGFWEVYRATAGDHIRGNSVLDAHIAALMRQHGVAVIYTRDRDFRRYDGIEPRDPFT